MVGRRRLADLGRTLSTSARLPGTDRQRALLAAVDDLVATRALDERRWTELRSHAGDAERIELCLLVGHYEMLATTIAAIGVTFDRELAPPP